MNFGSFLSDTLATILGGTILAVFFFWTREKCFGIPNILGRWYFQMDTLKTSYHPYEGMILRYIAVLWREGNRVSGTVEKYYEISSTGEREYVGTNRVRGVVDGYLEKRYFSKDKLHLHVIESGFSRESTHYFELTVVSNKIMEGNFSSMIADQDGKSRWQRTSF